MIQKSTTDDDTEPRHARPTIPLVIARHRRRHARAMPASPPLFAAVARLCHCGETQASLELRLLLPKKRRSGVHPWGGRQRRMAGARGAKSVHGGWS